MSAIKTVASQLPVCASMIVLALVCAPVFLCDTPWPHIARDYLEHYGCGESGAQNLVSAIYLGYRAFDTFGETIVLLAALSGAIAILRAAGAFEVKDGGAANDSVFVIHGEKRRSHALRTNLVETLSGKLGPVVLLFGFYLMLYGHLSPGGGFQGGVVIASGIVFLALGSRADSMPGLVREENLERLESLSFFMLVCASLSALFLGAGFFDNPLRSATSNGVAFIIILNTIIGLKVGAGIGYVCIKVLGKVVE